MFPMFHTTLTVTVSSKLARFSFGQKGRHVVCANSYKMCVCLSVCLSLCVCVCVCVCVFPTNLDPYGRNGSGFVWYCTVVISINTRTMGCFLDDPTRPVSSVIFIRALDLVSSDPNQLVPPPPQLTSTTSLSSSSKGYIPIHTHHWFALFFLGGKAHIFVAHSFPLDTKQQQQQQQ